MRHLICTLRVLTWLAITILASQSSAEIASCGFSRSVAAADVPRSNHTATLLQSGRVLVSGGFTLYGENANVAQLYDPVTGTWSRTGNQAFDGWVGQTATLLLSGEVLAVSICTSDIDCLTAQIYNETSNEWSLTESTKYPHYSHTATLLPSGKVLVVGGGSDGQHSEIYDPQTRHWTDVSDTDDFDFRYSHTATLLRSGKVLLAGGTVGKAGPTMADAQLFDPETGNYAATGSMTSARSGHIATRLPNGKVLVTGGQLDRVGDVEVYDPETGTWQSVAPLNDSINFLHHTATLLPSGMVLIAGGYWNAQTERTSTIQVYAMDATDPLPACANALTVPRLLHTATLLRSGAVLFVGGHVPDPDHGDDASAEEYRYAYRNTSSIPAAPLANARDTHTATLLATGEVLVVGGGGTSGFIGSAERYDPGANSWTSASQLTDARQLHTATLLPSGEVLVVGGRNTFSLVSFTLAELYDPQTNSWAVLGDTPTAHAEHTATLLASGNVLIAGGFNSEGASDHLEIFDPSTKAFSPAGNMLTARFGHTATLLPTGKVLFVGGNDSSGNVLSSAELYDPVAMTVSPAASLSDGRAFHTATIIGNGQVLVVGGNCDSGAFCEQDGAQMGQRSVELYDPQTDSWLYRSPTHRVHVSHTTTLLSSGDVLVAGGDVSGQSVEIYQSSLDGWIETTGLAEGRTEHTATLLASGEILLAGGIGAAFATLATSELLDEGLLYEEAWRPRIDTVAVNANPASSIIVSGVGFAGLSSNSGGGNGQDSGTDFPLLELRALDSGLTRLLPVDPARGWSDSSFTAPLPKDFPKGWARVTVTVGAIPSISRFVLIEDIQ